STFNFVFENQLEKLQDGDRVYYLERTAGLNFNTELENNSFAKLIMANTNATHLPGIVFKTPSFTFEVDPTKQFTGLGVDGRADPVSDDPSFPTLMPLVIRDQPRDHRPRHALPAVYRRRSCGPRRHGRRGHHPLEHRRRHGLWRRRQGPARRR